MTLRRARIFLIHWTLAVVAAALAFVVHLAMRGRTVSLGYELGKARQEQARLREVKRVHELEAASYKTPERVEIVARSLLQMEPPGADRIVPLRTHPGPSAHAGRPDEGRARPDERAP
jgi:cell division protein FtsL